MDHIQLGEFYLPSIDICNSVAIGRETKNGNNSVTVGYKACAEDDAVAIGSQVFAKSGHAVILNVDVTELSKRVEKLEAIIANQQEIIDALWYHPGMPGFTDAKESFDMNTSKLNE